MSVVSDAAAKYRLCKDVLAPSRLNHQHYIWKETLGFLLHPSFNTSKPDIATRRWTARLAETLGEQGFANDTKDEFMTDNYLLVLDQSNSIQIFGKLASNTGDERKTEVVSKSGR